MTDSIHAKGNSYTRDDCIYAGAFFDGEGCVNITKAWTRTKEPQFKMQVTITNTDMPILEWYQERWGGAIYKHTRGRSILTDNPAGCWFVAWTGWQAAQVLRDWLPGIKVKRRQVENALTFQNLKDRVRRGKTTPPDVRAQLEQFWLKGRQLHQPDERDPGIEAVVFDDGSEQLELVDVG